MLQGKKILLGVTGSIAAYKSLLLVRLLVREGAAVRVIQTPASRDFVTPLSLATLSKNPVHSDLFAGDTWANHVELGRWADVFVIAPLSCNTLAKMANGLCDNLLLATYLSAICPVLAAPAMDEDMWRHRATQDNLQRIRGFGNQVIPVEKGELASGLFGDGRMAEPETIVEFIRSILLERKDELAGRKALVTAGPTYEAIDPVRFIGNHSSGKMGIAIAEELAARGAQVHLVLGPSSLAVEGDGITLHRVTSAEEMHRVALAEFAAADIAILAAAVADYKPVERAPEKIKKKDGNLVLELTRTPDILRTLGGLKKPGQTLVGFALETTDGRSYALDKLRSKNADWIVLNTLSDNGAGFGFDTNKITIFGNDGSELAFEKKPKQQVAKDIVDTVIGRNPFVKRL
ncbi:MAG TPA: bifunctional phosphopantothenoylcysteine decarboxylase/phosphopantothenate--cysteine ligase CoaBC [Puia sp.]|uniref:bifunctional phosphopantothenoylcysteine decarboxylase/phosphopantothenate--cysteine ligase CoaBC n=1 Tax=Puia sp. TaxID=2045100 RepID=UPI002BD98501|nr:bifunctional phosphopantothenoylcysteine decarboxylase/phosphopantothenate--cysteine ligase CoaBC [Puia sp.]HVU93778.1 bifunctional phosphopantothenoylcysteine decarboxylase/phosphopantothenate--cysteine ligase CoaBC [Puia sp.]